MDEAQRCEFGAHLSIRERHNIGAGYRIDSWAKSRRAQMPLSTRGVIRYPSRWQRVPDSGFVQPS